MYNHLFLCETPGLYIGCKKDLPGTFDQFNTHIHDQYELDYFYAANGYYYIEGMRYPVFPGALLLLRPGESHMTQVKGDSLYERVTFNFSEEILQKIDPSGQLRQFIHQRRYPQILPSEEYNNFFRLLFHQLYTSTADSPQQKQQLGLSILNIALTVLKNTQQSAAQTNPGSNLSFMIQPIILYINKNLSSNLSIDDICTTFAVSKPYFSRRFKEITGITPWNYILTKRLITARQQIRQGATAHEASSAAGFQDYSSFYRAYTKHFGVTPLDDKLN